ncbi:MAG: hypothetical protein FWE33_01450 [Defluviitaleaceae bacterium]|nr:hypothetical protein [Defluviitaleaceae bacterium]
MKIKVKKSTIRKAKKIGKKHLPWVLAIVAPITFLLLLFGILSKHPSDGNYYDDF